MPLNTNEIERYTQQIKLPNWGNEGQLKLKQAKVLCVGAGGLGSPLLLYLAAAGVGTIGIVDNDVVDISNLSRQVLYQPDHVGELKAIVAQAQLQKQNPHLTIHAITERLDQHNATALIKQYDIVADCTDNFATRYILNDVCHQSNKPLVFASISQFQGQCAFLHGKQTPCLRCLFPTEPNETPPLDCNTGGVIGTLPGLLGTIQATEIIKWIIGIDETLVGKWLTVDVLRMQFQTYQLTRHPDCELCGTQPSKIISQQSSPKNDVEISLTELNHRLAQDKECYLLDVRTREEHREYNIGGILIPLQELPQRLHELDPSKPLIVYCRSGVRSLHAVAMLKQAGFANVAHLKNGIYTR